jgi:hypothetical protein
MEVKNNVNVDLGVKIKVNNNHKRKIVDDDGSQRKKAREYIDFGLNEEIFTTLNEAINCNDEDAINYYLKSDDFNKILKIKIYRYICSLNIDSNNERGFVLNIIANCYFCDNDIDVFKNEKKAFALYLQGAELGCGIAMNNVGYCYATGKGVEKDLLLAVKYYNNAIDKNITRAMINLAYCLEYGLGVAKDEEKAFKLYCMAHHQGDPNGKHRMAQCYQHGIGVVKDELEAIKLYKELVEDEMTQRGYLRLTQALYDLASCYENIDKNLAIQTFAKYYSLTKCKKTHSKITLMVQKKLFAETKVYFTLGNVIFNY